MKRCPSCQFINPSTRTRCLRCNTVLDAIVVESAEHLAKRRTGSRFQPAIWLRLLWAGLRNTMFAPLPEGISHRFPATAGWLAIFFGAGQLYNHQPRKALLFGAIQFALAIPVMATFFDPINDLWMALFIAWISYAVGDGYVTAARINGTRFGMKHVFAMAFAVIFFIGATLVAMQFFGTPFFRISRVNSDVMEPALVRGERLFVLVWPFGRRPEPGSVVFFSPERFTMQQPGRNLFIVRELTTFGVVSGVGGDVLSVSDNGPLLRNGVAVPPSLLPPNPNGILGAFTLTIPPGEFGVLHSHRISERGVTGAIDLPSPRDASVRGFIIQGWEDAATVPPDRLRGVALASIYPPQQRRWFGFRRGLWREFPANYPQNPTLSPENIPLVSGSPRP